MEETQESCEASCQAVPRNWPRLTVVSPVPGRPIHITMCDSTQKYFGIPISSYQSRALGSRGHGTTTLWCTIFLARRRLVMRHDLLSLCCCRLCLRLRPVLPAHTFITCHALAHVTSRRTRRALTSPARSLFIRIGITNTTAVVLARRLLGGNNSATIAVLPTVAARSGRRLTWPRRSLRLVM